MNKISERINSAREYAKRRWDAFVWFHLVSQNIRDRYNAALKECMELDNRCAELQTAAELWEEAYLSMRTAYTTLKDAKGAR